MFFHITHYTLHHVRNHLRVSFRSRKGLSSPQDSWTCQCLLTSGIMREQISVLYKLSSVWYSSNTNQERYTRAYPTSHQLQVGCRVPQKQVKQHPSLGVPHMWEQPLSVLFLRSEERERQTHTTPGDDASRLSRRHVKWVSRIKNLADKRQIWGS